MKWPAAELMPLNHGLNDAQLDEVFCAAFEKDVIMVDYSLRTRELNDQMDRVAKSFRILDHHKTAQAALDGADYATFDMKRSGAGLAWDYLFGKDRADKLSYEGHKVAYVPRPWWVDYTEDQDLWNWALPNSHEVNAYLMVQPRTMDSWRGMLAFLNIDKEDSIKQVTKLGKGVRQYIEYYTRSVVAEKQEGVLTFEGRNYRTAVLNIPYAGVSEAGNALCKEGYEIGLAWFERGDGITQFSLRSEGDVDVSAIAKYYGGGGHMHAAGFQLSLVKGRQLVDLILGRMGYGTTRCRLVVPCGFRQGLPRRNPWDVGTGASKQGHSRPFL